MSSIYTRVDIKFFHFVLNGIEWNDFDATIWANPTTVEKLVGLVERWFRLARPSPVDAVERAVEMLALLKFIGHEEAAQHPDLKVLADDVIQYVGGIHVQAVETDNTYTMRVLAMLYKDHIYHKVIAVVPSYQ